MPLTVKELIAKLQTCAPDWPVFVYGQCLHDGGFAEEVYVDLKAGDVNICNDKQFTSISVVRIC